ncbi:MAG: DUF481 domain-containing protein [Pseudomonadota bacterium]
MFSFVRIFVVMIAMALPVCGEAGVIVLKNGDRITGSIKKIWDAEVSIEPDYADEFTVDMVAIESIESDDEFEITLADGREVVARPAGSDAEGNQKLIIDEQTVTVGVDTLTELEEIDDYFDWEFRSDFSNSLNSGNTDSVNSRLYATGFINLGDHRHIASTEFIREEQNSETTKQQDILRYNYNWLFSDPWFLGAGYSFERDPIRELDQRSIVSAGIGRDIFNTPNLFMNFQFGGGFITEELSNEKEDSSVVNWQFRYTQEIINDLDVFHNHSIAHYVSGRDNTIYKTSTGVRYEITDLLYANLQLDYNYETDVAEEASNEDIAWILGVGIEFE